MPELHRTLLVFRIGSYTAALSLDSVSQVVPMASLGRPPGLPSALEGVVNLAGVAVPVLRLDRLLGIDPQPPELYSMLIVLKPASFSTTESNNRGTGFSLWSPTAILTNRVTGLLTGSEKDLLPVPPEDSFNACAESIIQTNGTTTYVLSLPRLLLEKERQALNEFQATAQNRLSEWEPLAS